MITADAEQASAALAFRVLTGGRKRQSLPLAVMEIAALVVSIVSALGAVGAVWYARRSDRSAAKVRHRGGDYGGAGHAAPER